MELPAFLLEDLWNTGPMGLRKYQQKRTFGDTPEAKGTTGKRPDGLRFVIQKHAASRPHHDLRLELWRVMKSWAVPKGPSLDPENAGF
mgnify:CR=1 FL=1